ncbi:hypothetical protein NQZ68_000165 [Dissostichus eleginoides]|nr:hypothetical protein NQZ68_000165 [Dissostichus eleginoides]
METSLGKLGVIQLSIFRDRRVKSWTVAKRGRPTMQLKLLQAKQEETQGAIEEEKEEKKNSAKVGSRTEANTAQGRAEGDPKAGELIMCVFVFCVLRLWVCLRFGHTKLQVTAMLEQASLCHPVYGQTHSRQ